MKLLHLVACAIAVLFFSSNATLAADHSSATNSPSPVRLDLLWVGMPLIASCRITGDEQKLTCFFRQHLPQTYEIAPTKEAWTNFWKSMDQVKVWEWKSRYDNPKVRDGLAWSLEIQRGDRKVVSGGSNGYPGSGNAKPGGWGPTALFMEYQKAVEELIGRPIWEK